MTVAISLRLSSTLVVATGNHPASMKYPAQRAAVMEVLYAGWISSSDRSAHLFSSSTLYSSSADASAIAVAACCCASCSLLILAGLGFSSNTIKEQ